MNVSLVRSKQTQRLVNRRLFAISSKPKQELSRPTNVSSTPHWNGNHVSAVGATRKSSGSTPRYFGEEEFPMKLAHFIQRRNKMSLQEKWGKLASLTMEPSSGSVPDAMESTLQKNIPLELPRTLTQAMSDARPCVIASLDDPFTIVNVNQAWCEVYGYTKVEVLNQNLVRLLEGNSNSQEVENFVIDQILSCSDTGGFEGSSSLAKVTHHTRDGQAVKEPLRVGTIAIGADVSDQYMVCVTDMDSTTSTATTAAGMINSLEEPMTLGQAGLV